MTQKHHTLIIGSGGREHALADILSSSSVVADLYIAPGNGGTEQWNNVRDLDVNNVSQLADFIREKQISLLVVGPEDPLVNGLRNELAQIFDEDELAIVGPDKSGAELEGSKDFAKKFMERHDIPTAAYRTFSGGEADAAKKWLQSGKAPFVLKADGLAAGKGVLILNELSEAEKAVDEILEGGKFGKAGNKLVIEEFLSGLEFSVFAACDGENHLILPIAKDYKRIGEGDTGLNTGGMGAISPVPFVDEALMKKVEDLIVKPTVAGLKKEGIDYRGFIFFGLIKVGDHPYVIEYNCRLGDPETEVVLPRIQSDFGDLCLAIHRREIPTYQLEVRPESACTVMLVSGGYPESYKKGFEITGLESDDDQLKVFHAGTRLESEKIQTNGGRVIAVTAYGQDYKQALLKAYNKAGQIHFEGVYYRKDLGFDL